jgi:NAD(P)-dependent dehydrogenase (short-subunit alcohol dehydrogenase family)
MEKLTNKRAIITGASEGLGRVIAEFFLREGADVMICARNAETLFKTQQELLALKRGKVEAKPCDVANLVEVKALIDKAFQVFGQIDILVCNAGIHGPKGCFEETDWALWSEAIDVNLKGSAFLCHELVPHFKRNKYGKIIFLSGGGATKSMPYFTAYAASKAGLVRFGETLADELKDFNIDINMVAPGAMNTGLLDDVLNAGPEKVGQKYYQTVLKQQASGGTSREIAAELCVFLASDESREITGKLISAVWDPWKDLPQHIDDLRNSDIYTLRRIIPAERNKTWGEI